MKTNGIITSIQERLRGLVALKRFQQSQKNASALFRSKQALNSSQKVNAACALGDLKVFNQSSGHFPLNSTQYNLQKAKLKTARIAYAEYTKAARLRALTQEIENNGGTLSLGQFWQSSLYGQDGYYVSGKYLPASQIPIKSINTPPCFKADFTTFATSPLMGVAVLKLIKEEILRNPSMKFINLADGPGNLLRNLIDTAEKYDPKFLSVLIPRILSIDISPKMVDKQKNLLMNISKELGIQLPLEFFVKNFIVGSSINIAERVRSLFKTEVSGIIFSNELLDSMPHEGVYIKGWDLQNNIPELDVLIFQNDAEGEPFLTTIPANTTKHKPILDYFIEQRNYLIEKEQFDIAKLPFDPEKLICVNTQDVSFLNQADKLLEHGHIITIDYARSFIECLYRGNELRIYPQNLGSSAQEDLKNTYLDRDLTCDMNTTSFEAWANKKGYICTVETQNNWYRSNRLESMAQAFSAYDINLFNNDAFKVVTITKGAS